MVKEKQPKGKFQKSFSKSLGANESSQLTKGGEQILSNLLYMVVG